MLSRAILASSRPLAARALGATPVAAEKVGVIGLGKMGSAMAVNLIEGGHSLSVFDVTPGACDDAAAAGAAVADSPAAVAAASDVVITMLPNDAVLNDVTLEQGVLEAMAPGSLHVSCSTVSPHTARALAEAHEAAGSAFVGAPVFARPDGVRAKQVSIVMGGADAAVARAKAVLEATASGLFSFGEDPGAGNVVKLCGNYLIATSIEAMGESLALAEANGVDRVDAINMLNSTIFDCLIYKGYGQRVSERDHVPGGFALELGLKDVALVLDTARRSNVPMPFGSVLHDRFLTAKAKGWSELDWSAIGLGISEDSGVDVSADVERCRP